MAYDLYPLQTLETKRKWLPRLVNVRMDHRIRTWPGHCRGYVAPAGRHNRDRAGGPEPV